jgi:iron complex outermembrane receptor protein
MSRHLALTLAALSPVAFAQQPTATSPVVVTATRIEQPSFDLPLSIDSIDGTQIQSQRLKAGVSEALQRIPGTVVQNRETYAQEQQIVIRGFGARSQFGVRGIRLIADGIPASTPDGQGGSGLFDLGSAARIEVLRGPFSALYGNHSGGVVQIFTEDGPDRPTLSGDFTAGSYDTWRAGVKFGGQSGAMNYVGSVSRLETDGYRDWSETRKDQANAKLRLTLNPGSTLTLLANYLDQPDNLDPLGLTAAQLAADRRQANPDGLAFKTRRSLDNLQGGALFETVVSQADTLRAIAYFGSRGNEQFLAIPLATQQDLASSLRHPGAVSVIDRDFGGAGLRWTHRRPGLSFTAGADYERAQDARKGYLNVAGTRGALKRDEVSTVDQSGAYAQIEWHPASAWVVSAGLRYTRVHFDSRDNFICTTLGSTCSGATQTVSATRFNPDDSGALTHSAWTPVFGLLYKASPALNAYFNAGRSFETPTFVELAYRPDGSSGLNFDLRPSRSNHYEVGLKAFLGSDVRLNAAMFQIDTDNEIVVLSNAGGRATFRNAGKTQRRGVEIAADGALGAGFWGYFSATYLDARFKDTYRTCVGIPCTTPNATVNADNRLPGVPSRTLFGEIVWRHAPVGFDAAVEARWNSKVYANDLNTASADSYFVASVRAGFEQVAGGWQIKEFLRVDNVFDEEYIGAVYVNDGNERFFAPAPERNYLVGLSASYRF